MFVCFFDCFVVVVVFMFVVLVRFETQQLAAKLSAFELVCPGYNWDCVQSHPRQMLQGILGVKRALIAQSLCVYRSALKRAVL